MAKYLTVNAERKTLTIDRTVKPTADELEDITLYLSAGYTIRHKSVKNIQRGKELAKKAKAKAKETKTEE